jgi:hypothetical protein
MLHFLPMAGCPTWFPLSFASKKEAMDNIWNINLILHIAAGTLTLLLGPVAIYTNQQYLQVHRPVGKVFYYAMIFVCASAAFSFARHPNHIFAQFLLGIAVFVWAGIMRGVRALQLMKRAPVVPWDYVYTGLLALGGLAMVGRSIWLWSMGASIAFPILFMVFGAAALWDVRSNLQFFRQAEQMHRLDWLRVHVLSMVGAFIASTTAFTVNAAPFLPWYLQWFGPTLILTPVQIYFGRRIRLQKTRLSVQASK